MNLDDICKLVCEHRWASSLVLWPVLTGLINLALRARSPEAWVKLGEQRPRTAALIKFLRATGLDPVKAVKAVVQLTSGKSEAPISTNPTIDPDSTSKVEVVIPPGARGPSPLVAPPELPPPAADPVAASVASPVDTATTLDVNMILAAAGASPVIAASPGLLPAAVPYDTGASDVAPVVDTGPIPDAPPVD